MTEKHVYIGYHNLEQSFIELASRTEILPMVLSMISSTLAESCFSYWSMLYAFVVTDSIAFARIF